MDVDRRSALLIGAWIAVNLGITQNSGTYYPTALGLVLVGAALACAAVVALRRLGPASGVDMLLFAAAAGASVAMTVVFPVLSRRDGTYALSRDLGVLSAVVALILVAAPIVYRRVLALSSLALAGLGLGLSVEYLKPPPIDVWFILTEGSERMASGHNIFTSCWPGNTDRLTDCVYPYLPMTTIVQTPFRWALGDIRYSYIAALLLSAFFVWRLAGRAWGPLLAALVLVSPSIRYLVVMAWTEPLLLVGLAGMVLAVLRGRMVLAILAFGFALACKQHVLLLIPLAAWWPAFGLRRTVTSLVGAGLVTLPWFVVDPSAFLDDALRFNLHLEPRRDSLSLFTTALEAGWKPPFFLVGALTIAAIVAVMYYVPRTATGFVLGSDLVLFAFSLLNKQSFFNEWWLVGALALLAIATAIAESAHDDQPDGSAEDASVP